MMQNIKKNAKYILLIFVLIAMFSCTPRKDLIYFNKGISDLKDERKNILNDYKLRSGDLLYVKVQTMDEKTYRLFNFEWVGGAAKNEYSVFIDSYSISDSGCIQIPIIGEVYLKDLTLDESQKKLQQCIDAYLLDAIVNIKLINFKITILGEVNKPGTYKIHDNSITVLEALSIAGDMTVWGNRKNIMILRKSENSVFEYLDITNVNVINSDFFYLKPDDVIYIQPNFSKTLGFKEFPFSILFSSITTIIVLLRFFEQ